MKTREALEKIPKKAQAKLKQYRALYNNERLPENDRALYRTQAAAYCMGLYHAGIITDLERRLLYTYTTV